MRQQTGDEVERRPGELVLGLGVVKDVLAVFEDREVGVHTRTVDAGDRFGHEGGVQTVQ